MKAELGQIWRAGVAACLAERVLPAHLPPPPSGRAIILAVGKAAAGMAAVAEAHFGGQAEGFAIVPHGTEATLERIALLHAGHPIPDEASMAAAEALLRLAAEAEPPDRVIALLSGGASALACLPGDGLSLAEKQALTAALLGSGAPIGEVNCVRRHLSRFKGGRLRADLTLAICDVPGDRPEDIGSGPTVADPTTISDARAILARRRIDAPARGWSETVKRRASDFRIVARPADAIAAAAREAERLGYRPVILGLCNGDAHATGTAHALEAMRAPPGTAFISGGELTSPVDANAGRGGRNHVYALAAASRLGGTRGIAGLAADTDGLDGSSGAAGAFFDGAPIAGAAEALAAGDSASVADPFVTGPTGTNVNDLRIILVAP
jgi:glycerate 2-kinase